MPIRTFSGASSLRNRPWPRGGFRRPIGGFRRLHPPYKYEYKYEFGAWPPNSTDRDRLLQAAKTLRKAGFTTLDAYTPYPVHGMVKAIGMKRSHLPWITLCGSITGLALAIFMQFYLMGWYYPTIVQDKQYTSWEAFVPIMFELMVLVQRILHGVRHAGLVRTAAILPSRSTNTIRCRGRRTMGSF